MTLFFVWFTGILIYIGALVVNDIIKQKREEKNGK